DFLAGLDNADIKGLKVGLPKEYYGQAGLDAEVSHAVGEAIEQLKAAGAETVEVSLPHTDYAVACYYLIATAEASSNLARYDGVHYGYRTPSPSDLIDLYSRSRAEALGDEVKRRIMLGTYVLSAGYYEAYYLKALKVRTLIKRDFERAFGEVDVICSPVSPTPAFRIGETVDDPLAMYLSDIYTISANLAAIPGLSVPCGLSRAGLPIGLQILGRHFDEPTVLRVGAAYQARTDHHRQRPPIASA
ncbi:MAG: Asp-tRNA(Asn)/Glu-tRNA(Gln) amidotransferase subunit GatA, partial [Phycisphaerae bacterium]|nr:Asp-tRNA(Asn)/Glu-tRNA(Gln) amidotransferase subunit GatA [Phycisphaerae bacterium]